MTRARLRPLGLCRAVALWLALCVPAFADCATDSRGEAFCGGGACASDRNGVVWCARSYRGGAVRNRNTGQVVCGQGHCAVDRKGRIFCSNQPDGAVLIDSRGRVRCYGRCEPAHAAYCERRIADIAN